CCSGADCAHLDQSFLTHLQGRPEFHGKNASVAALKHRRERGAPAASCLKRLITTLSAPKVPAGRSNSTIRLRPATDLINYLGCQHALFSIWSTPGSLSHPPTRRILLQRTAGPYIGSCVDGAALARTF